MGNHGDGQPGNPEKFRFGFAECKKLIGAEGRNGDILFFQRYGVMDTP